MVTKTFCWAYLFTLLRVQSKLSNWKKDSVKRLNKTDKYLTGPDSKLEIPSGKVVFFKKKIFLLKIINLNKLKIIDTTLKRDTGEELNSDSKLFGFISSYLQNPNK